MTPKYQVIAEELRIHIQAGKYAGAQTLPTEFEIANEYRVSRQTVRQALSVLTKEGLIERRQGSGSYIRQEPARESRTDYAIAVITTYISDYIFPSILREAETVLSQNGCTPSLFATQNQVRLERKVLTKLLESPVDGILVEGTKSALPNPNLDLYRKILDKGVPLVFMNGHYANLQGALSVLDDNYGGGRMLVEYLCKKGHQRIAGIFKSDDLQGHQRYAGYADALLEAGLPVDDQRLFWYNTGNKSQLLSGAFPETVDQALKTCSAVVCYNDEIASRLEAHLMRKGLRIPEDMAIVSFDNSLYSDLSPVRITSLSHGENNVGRMAAELLIRLMRGEPCHSELAPWVLMEKESS